jgi:hypothetical protein
MGRVAPVITGSRPRDGAWDAARDPPACRQAPSAAARRRRSPPRVSSDRDGASAVGGSAAPASSASKTSRRAARGRCAPRAREAPSPRFRARRHVRRRGDRPVLVVVAVQMVDRDRRLLRVDADGARSARGDTSLVTTGRPRRCPNATVAVRDILGLRLAIEAPEPSPRRSGQSPRQEREQVQLMDAVAQRRAAALGLPLAPPRHREVASDPVPQRLALRDERAGRSAPPVEQALDVRRAPCRCAAGRRPPAGRSRCGRPPRMSSSSSSDGRRRLLDERRARLRRMPRPSASRCAAGRGADVDDVGLLDREQGSGDRRRPLHTPPYCAANSARPSSAGVIGERSTSSGARMARHCPGVVGARPHRVAH